MSCLSWKSSEVRITKYQFDNKVNNQIQNSRNENKIILEKVQPSFHFDRVIGHGQFGKVYLAKENYSGLLFAVKAFKRAVLNRVKLFNQVINEIEIHSKLRHPHIIPFYTYFINNMSVCMVMELAPGGSLHDYRLSYQYNRLPEHLVAKYVFQIALALEYCHSLRYIHRDVKPENVLLDVHGDAKLSDFGWSVELNNKLHQYCGTLDYIAPEMLSHKNYNHCIDIWCLGVMCYELLSGRNPFYSRKRKIMYEKIIKVDFKFSKFIPLPAKELIIKLIQRHPSKRLPLKKLLVHPWIIEYHEIGPSL